ncbi:type VI secretion system contractile sheath domain-containing protein, partial [Burkholderia ubonensis]|uniref:type VI secretion system contractile sheath domain-containing protein n=1 Tax=Burkholderia ubonensis TaxID=101571 RepID=UPI001E50DE5D
MPCYTSLSADVRPYPIRRPTSAGFQSDQYTKTAVVSDTHARANSNAMTCMDPDLLDWCLADLDEQLGRQLDAILHHPAFQALESTWRGLQFLVDRTDFRQNVKIEV